MSSQTTERFLRAAGGAASIRVMVDSKSHGSQVYSNAGWRRQFKFDQPFILIGNHERADLRLDSEAISRRQVYLQLLNGRLFATHLSKRVPTRWGAAEQTAGWIDRDTEISIGPYTLRFDWIVDPRHARAASNENPMSAGSFPGPAVTLELKDGRPGSNRAVIDRALTLVGSYPICKLRMHSSHISAVHCSLVRTEEGLWVIDLASREGVQVNNATVRTALLADGDLLQIGGRRIKIRYRERMPITSETERMQLESSDVLLSPDREPVQADVGADLDDAGDAMDHWTPPDELSIPVSALEPIIDKMTELQAQTYEQFQELMNAMIMTFGSMFMEHREFVGQEFEKLEQIARALAAAPHESNGALPALTEAPTSGEATASLALPLPPEPAAPAANAESPPAQPAPAPAEAEAPISLPTGRVGRVPQGAEFHIWLAQRVGELGRRRASRWETLMAALRSKMPGGARE